MKKHISIILLLILICVLSVSLISCSKGTSADVPNNDVGSTIIYDQEIIDAKYLKEKVSEATSIYYKSNDNGEFGDENQLFEYTTLPSLYSEVDYIESDGHQFIDTNVLYNENLSFELKFSSYSSSKNNGGVFGTNGLAFSLYRSDKKALSWSVNDAKTYTYSSFSPYKEYIVNCSSNQMYVNGVKTEFAPIKGITGNSNIYIFKNYYGYGTLKLYYFKIYEEGVLIRDFIPCYNNLDTTIGLYDLITETFYTNSYGSIFENPYAEYEKFDLPNEYQQIEYIETDGTQYIDTGINFDFNNDSFEMTTQSTKADQNGMMLCDFTNSNYSFFLYHYAEGGLIALFANDASSSQICLHSGLSSTDLGKHTYIFNNKILYIDGTIASNESERTFWNFTGTIRLFNSNNTEQFPFGYVGKCFGCKILKGETIVRNYVPAISIENQTIGLYDTIENKFYTSCSLIPFVAGNRIYNIQDNTEYSQTEYIECSGSQYIDTNYIPTVNTSLEITFSVNSFIDTSYIFGSAGTNNNDNALELYPYNNTLQANIDDSNITISNAKTNTISSIIFSQGNIYYKDDLGVYNLINTGLTMPNTPVNLCLFAINRNGTVIKSSQCKIYSCKILEGTTLVRNFIPYLRNVDRKPGLYDIENDVFYTNNGTGEFITTSSKFDYPNISLSSDLPNEYESIQYIQSTGTQWINTNLTVTETTFVDADIMFDSAFDYNMMFGVWPCLSLSLINENKACVSGCSAETQNIGANISQNIKCNIKMGLSSFSINNKYYSFGTQNNIPSNTDFLLFAASVNNMDLHTPYLWGDKYSSGKIYSFKIYDNNVLVRYYIPALRKVDQKPGLFDVVNSVFYTNSGTGEFNYSFYSDSYKSINSDSLIAHYIFNGDGCDSSNNLHNQLTYNKANGVVSTYSNYLRNTSSTISINELNGINSNFSVSCWVMLPRASYTIYKDLFAFGIKKDGGTTQKLRLEIVPDNGPYLLFVSPNNYYTALGGASKIKISYDTWIHVSYVIKDDSIITYIDGNKVKTYTYPNSAHESVSLTGIFYLGDDIMTCYYNDLRIFGDCLTDIEVKHLASNSFIDLPQESPSDYEYLSSINISNYPINLGVFGDAKYTFDIQFNLINNKQLMGYDQFINNNWGISKDGYYISGNEIFGQAGTRDIFVDEYINGTTNKYLNGNLLYSAPYESLDEYTIGNISLSYSTICSYTLFSLAVEQNNQEIINYVPAKRLSDGVIGLYDTVNNTFILIHESFPTFSSGELVGHDFDDGEIIIPVSEKQNGVIVYTCKICGKQIRKEIDSHSYSLTFEYDEGIDYIKVFNGYDFSSFEKSDIGYTKNKNTNNFSKENGVVYFEIVFKEGYSIKQIKTQGALCNIEQENIYIASMIYRNTIFTIKTQKK